MEKGCAKRVLGIIRNAERCLLRKNKKERDGRIVAGYSQFRNDTKMGTAAQARAHVGDWTSVP